MDLKFILESILFSAQKPLSVKEIRDVLANAAEQLCGRARFGHGPAGRVAGKPNLPNSVMSKNEAT